MLGLLLICAIFYIFLVVLVSHNGNTKGSFLLFYIVNEIYEYHKAQSAISLFQMKELFSHRFRGFKLEYSTHATYATQSVFQIFLTSTSDHSNNYVNDCGYNPVLCPNKLIYQRQITA